MNLYYLVLLMSLICAKGSAMKRLENFRVISYRLVSSDYHYSDERMKWRGKYYMPFLYEEYRKGTLQNVGIYKSTPVRDKDLLRKVPIAYSFQCARAVPLAYSRRNSMQLMPHKDS